MSVIKKKKLLIIGNASSLWLKRYVDHVLCGGNYDVYLKDILGSDYEEFYRSKGVKNYRVDSLVPQFLQRVKKVPILLILLRLAVRRFTGARYDYVHVHFLDKGNIRFALCSSCRKSKKIASFWGSDLLRADEKTIGWLEKKLRIFDAITIQDRETMKQAYAQKINRNLSTNLYRVLFPGENDSIDRIEATETLAESRNELTFPSNRYVIAIGYNANAMQQHNKVLLQIEKIPSSVQEQIHLVFLFTYPCFQETYKEILNESLRHLSCTSTYFEDRLTDMEIARVQRSCDMFIHAQTSDAASASIKEFLKAGCLLLNPSWIRYQEWTDQGVSYIEYSDFSELPILIEDAVKGKLTLDTQKNKEILRDTVFIEKIRETWLSIYGDLLQDPNAEIDDIQKTGGFA